VSQLWARAKIAGFEESRYSGCNADEVDEGVVKTGLDFHLVSRLTSLVAIDKTPARPAGERLDTRQIASMLPKGWEFGGVFGPQAEARAIRFDRLPDTVMQKINARVSKDKPADETTLALPQTASGWETTSAFGLSLNAVRLPLSCAGGRSALSLRGSAYYG